MNYSLPYSCGVPRFRLHAPSTLCTGAVWAGVCIPEGRAHVTGTKPGLGCLASVQLKSESLLIVADSERDADMLYAVGMFLPDSFVFLRSRKGEEIVLPDVEVMRARRHASHCHIRPWSTLQRKLRRNGDPPPGLARMIRQLLREHRVRRVRVPHSFPLGLANELRDLKVKVKAAPNPLFPERQFKSAAEIKRISAALTMAEVGMAEGIYALHNSRINRDRKLIYRNAPLTSERLRAIIDTAILQAGGITCRTIVAGGRQSFDPHEPGHGPLRANEPIVLDVFPRSQQTGYFGDLTRTVVRGKASEHVRAMFAAVQRAQDAAFRTALAGVAAQAVHETVWNSLETSGFKTRLHGGRAEGFLHASGHGIGLDLHEAPQVSAASPDILQSGNVLALEPGLYYPSVGGVRLEDVVQITSKSTNNLTQFEKVLEV